jgi:hypothetical protein
VLCHCLETGDWRHRQAATSMTNHRNQRGSKVYAWGMSALLHRSIIRLAACLSVSCLAPPDSQVCGFMEKWSVVAPMS